MTVQTGWSGWRLVFVKEDRLSVGVTQEDAGIGGAGGRTSSLCSIV